MSWCLIEEDKIRFMNWGNWD